MSLRLLCALIAPLLLNACAFQLRTPLPEPVRSSIQSVKAHVTVIQDEVMVDVQPSMSAGAGVMFGALGAIITSSIDSAVTNSRMRANLTAIENFYPKIDDIDFRKGFGDALSRRMGDYPLKVTEVFTTPRGLTKSELKKKMESFKPNEALLVVYPFYRLTGDYRYLYGSAVMTLWTKDKDEHQYRGHAIYQSRAMGTGGADSLTLWSQDNAVAFRAAITEVIDELVDMTLTDVKLDPNAKLGEAKTFPIGARAVGMPTEANGQVIFERNGRVRILDQAGFLFSIPATAQ